MGIISSAYSSHLGYLSTVGRTWKLHDGWVSAVCCKKQLAMDVRIPTCRQPLTAYCTHTHKHTHSTHERSKSIENWARCGWYSVFLNRWILQTTNLYISDDHTARLKTYSADARTKKVIAIRQLSLTENWLRIQSTLGLRINTRFAIGKSWKNCVTVLCWLRQWGSIYNRSSWVRVLVPAWYATTAGDSWRCEWNNCTALT